MARHGIRRLTALGKAVIATAVTVFTILATTGTAGAVSGPGPNSARPDFSAQARSVGLNTSQAAALQDTVNGYLATMGGTQTAINKIDLSAGGRLLIPLPGEQRARDLSAPDGPEEFCPYTYVCAFSLPNFWGTSLQFFTCNQLNRITWTGTGSWINNQRAALHAKFYDRNGNLGWTSPGGLSWDVEASWDWVWWLSPC